MAQTHDGTITLINAETDPIPPFRRVKYHTTIGQVVFADAADGNDWIGTTLPGIDGDPANGENVTIALRTEGSTFKVEASAAVTKNASLYPEDDGKVSDDPGTVICGTAAGTSLASGSGSIIEFHPTGGTGGPASSATEIWVAKNGNDGNPGSIELPLLTITAAFAAATATRDTIMVMPGIYTEAATVTWPSTTDLKLSGIAGSPELTRITAPTGENVIDIDPTTVATFESTLANLTIVGDGDCSGLRLDNGGQGSSKMNTYLNDVHIEMDNDAYEAIEQVHGDNLNAAMRIYHHGNNSFDGLMAIEPGENGDKYFFHGASFGVGFAVGNGDFTAEFEFRDCLFQDDSASGDEGHTNQTVAMIGCVSKTGTTYAAADKEDIGTNMTVTVI